MTKSEKVNIAIQCLKLKNVAGAFKGTSDPYAVVTLLASDATTKPRILGKTEVVKNTLSPSFVQRIEIEYEFGKLTHFTVAIFDAVSKKKGDKSMGSAMFEVGAILSKRGNVLAKRLRKSGTIFAKIEKIEANGDSGDLSLSLAGYKIKNVEGIFSKSDPFFEVHGETGPNEFSNLVYRSEFIKNNLNPVWKEATLNLNRLCSGDRTKAFRISVYDYERSGKHVLIGSATTNANEVIAAKTGSATDKSAAIPLTVRGTRKEVGRLIVVKASIINVKNTSPVKDHKTSVPNDDTEVANSVANLSLNEEDIVISPVPVRPTFVDYLSGGCEILTNVAIDFTGSNGDPRKPGTLHHFSKTGQLNQYEKAISSIVGILSNYDSDHLFPVLGFGAKMGGIVRHLFQVGPTKEVSGVQGVLDAYRSVFNTGLIMSGPTVFDEVIRNSATRARAAQAKAAQIGSQAYTVLLLLTDGAVSDIRSCSQALDDASDAPLSIVIVGIGNADFSPMQFLDDRKGSRDICQFVEFRAHQHDKQSLTAATLDEIPDQLVEYYQMNNIQPMEKLERRGSILNDYVPDASEEEEVVVGLEIGDDGEVVIASGGLYDQTSYEINCSAPIMSSPAHPVRSSATFSVPNPGGDHTPSYGVPPSFNPSVSPLSPQYHGQPYPVPGIQSYTVPYDVSDQKSSVYPSNQYTQNHAYTPNAPIAVAQAVPVQNRFFPVQVPEGVVAGQQLKVQNPYTGQFQIVSVPPGVGPFGTFNVEY